MSDNKQLSLAAATSRWDEMQAGGAMALQRPTSLMGMLDQSIQLSKTTFRLQDLNVLNARLSKDNVEVRRLSNFDYKTHTLKYFDDFSTKFTELAITFEGPQYDKEDYEEVVQFLAKQRILVYKQGSTPPDMAEIGLFYRRAPISQFSSEQDAGQIPLKKMLNFKDRYRLSGVSHHTLASAVSYVPQLRIRYGRFFVPEEKLTQKLIRGRGTHGEPYAYVPISMRASYRLYAADEAVAGMRFYLNQNSDLEIVTEATFPHYDTEEVQTRLLTPGGVEPIDPEVDCPSHVGTIPVTPLDLCRGGIDTYMKWLENDGRVVGHIHNLLGSSLDSRWLLNVDAETDDKLAAIAEEEPDNSYKSLSMSMRFLLGTRYRAGTQSEATQHESLAWFLLFSGMPQFDENDAVHHPSPKPHESVAELMGASVDPSIPDSKIMHLQFYWHNPRRAEGKRRLFVLDTTRKSLRKLTMYAAKSWRMYFQTLVESFEDVHARVIAVDADGVGILATAIDELHEMISYLDDVLVLDDWMGLSQKQSYLKARAFRDRIGKFFVNPDGANLFYGMLGDRPTYYARHDLKVGVEVFGSERFRYAMAFTGEMLEDSDVTCGFNMKPEDLSDKLPSRRPPKVVEPVTSTDGTNVPKVQAGVVVVRPVEKESWIDKLFNYIFR